MRYAVWLQGWLTGSEPTQTAIAAAVARSQPAVRPWLVREEPPTDYRVHEKLAVVLHVPERWLIEGKGEPPEPKLWSQWITRERARVPAQRAPVTLVKPAKSGEKKRRTG